MVLIMPWYPGPDGRYVTSFWDGQQWLISLTDDYLILEGRTIALDDIAEVAYWNRTIVSLPGPANSYRSGGSHIGRGFSVADGPGHNSRLDLDNSLVSNVPENEIAWRGLVDISRRFIEPRISQRIFESVRAGEEYSINDGGCFIKLSNGGFTGKVMRTKTYSLVVGGAVPCEPVSPSPFQSVRAVCPHTAYR